MARVTVNGHKDTRLRDRKWLVIVAVLLVICLIPCAYYIGRRIELSGVEEARGDPSAYLTEAPGIDYNGVHYTQKRDLTTLLFMGVDSEEDVQTTGFRQGGQADFLYLWIIDHENKTIYQCQIDRDTITDIVVLGVLGNETGTRKAQISLSHGFGDGGKQSCEYTARAVSYLLGGINIDFYMAFDMLSIGTLNDILGGVQVTIEDDFSAIDPEMTVGSTVLLNAEQAELFVRSRTSIGDGNNVSRMRRQREFLQNAMTAARAAISADANFTGELFDAMSDTMVTDISRGRLINEANQAANYTIEPSWTPDGEHVVAGDGFMEFYADSEDIMNWVVETFYTH